MNCPNCQRLLYSRIQPKCGHCGVVLPKECRLEDHEIDEIRGEIRQIEERRSAAREREEEEEKQRVGKQSGAVPFVPPMNFP